MSKFEKAIIYLSLICGTLFALLAKGGFGLLADGDVVRGVFFLAVSILALVGWVAPLTQRHRALGIVAGRWLTLLLVLFSAYGFLREHFFSGLPAAWP